MAVNPKLIIMAVEAAGNEKVRKAVLYTVFMALGVVMLIFAAFSGLISGLFSVIQNSDLKNHWNYFRNNVSEIFSGIEGDINTDVKAEVYDFMPEFSVNLSKATIANNFDGSSLILYDESEIEQAQNIMLDYAEQLRAIKTQEDFDSYISSFDTELSFSEISNIRFTDDTGIDSISEYGDGLKKFLYHRAMEQVPAYSYTFEKITVDEKPADRQTLVVTSPGGSTQTVEYTCIGGGSRTLQSRNPKPGMDAGHQCFGGEIYLPEFLAMYDIRQMREYLIAVSEGSAPGIDKQIEEAVGGIPETAEAAQEYLDSAWYSIIDGRGAINLDLFEVSNLKSLMEDASMDGAVSITTERTSDKLSITLETVGSDMWKEIFCIDESLWGYVAQSQLAIEMALDEAGIPQDERTISLDNMVQLALFTYFEGFFELPVSSSDLATGSSGILSQCGDVSILHKYKYSAKDYGVPENGITLVLGGKCAVYANLLDCGDCIQDAYIYDVWNMDEQDIDTVHECRTFNQSAVTIAYIIDTDQFEADYGFPFPQINGVSDTGTVTLFLEFTCLSSVEFTDLDIGTSIYDISDNLLVGYSHDGYYSDQRDMGLWRHSLNRDECVPHVGIKTYFMSGEVSQLEPPQGVHAYGGPCVKKLGAAANPRLWFKGFRTGMSEELFGTIEAVRM